jgi:hypothetical protein
MIGKLSDKIRFAPHLRGVKKLSMKTGLSPDAIKLTIIEEKRPEIEKYVKNAGQVPSKNPVMLATQVTLIREKKIADKMKISGKGYDDSSAILSAEEERQSYTGGEENFAGALLSVITSVGSKGIEGINAKRKETGKKPILSGAFWQSLKSKVSVDDEGVTVRTGEGRPMKDTELTRGLTAAQDELERQGKKSWLKKNLVLIILGVVILAAAIWYFTKKK